MSETTRPLIDNNPARGPLCQHVYPNGLRCYSMTNDERHQLVEGRPSPHRHLFEQRCSHTSLRREIFRTREYAIDLSEMVDACRTAAKRYDSLASVAEEPRKGVYERQADRLRAAARALAGQEIEP